MRGNLRGQLHFSPLFPLSPLFWVVLGPALRTTNDHNMLHTFEANAGVEPSTAEPPRGVFGSTNVKSRKLKSSDQANDTFLKKNKDWGRVHG